MKKRYWAFLIGSCCLSVGMQAAKVDTLSVHSDAMNKEVQVITICPDKAMFPHCPHIREADKVRDIFHLPWLYPDRW